MIINLRGTNGSGKSTVAHFLLAHDNTTRMIDLLPIGRKGFETIYTKGYSVPSLDLIVVGRYEFQCDGPDCMDTQDQIKQSVLTAAKYARHVFFEGVIISTIFSGYYALSQECLKLGQSYLWACLDTPLEVCIKRTIERSGNKLKGNIKADGTRSQELKVETKHKSFLSSRQKAIDAGELVYDVPHLTASEEILRLIHE